MRVLRAARPSMVTSTEMSLIMDNLVDHEVCSFDELA
jgi:hypothetical protein